MKKWNVFSSERVDWEWREIEAETEDEAVELAMENWVGAKQTDNIVEEIFAEEVKE
jgi:hypothetical protein